MVRIIFLIVSLLAVSFSTTSYAEKQFWQESGASDIKPVLNEKAKAVFDVIVFVVGLLGVIAYAVSAGMLVAGKPQEARSLGISTSVGLLMATLIAGIASIFL